MTSLEQIIIDKIHRFSIDKQRKVLDYADSLETAGSQTAVTNHTIWEMIEDLADKVPDEAWDEIPADASLNVNHYLYGHAKNIR